MAGLRPYRDYFTASTPLTVLKSAAELWLFGNAEIVSRFCGVIERVILGVLVYFWLARMFRASYAALAAIVTIIVSTGDYSDPLASYNHDTILLGVVSGLLASFSLDSLRSSRAVALFGAFSGLAAGLCFCTKQTIGIGITFAVPVIVCGCLWRLESLKKSAIFLGGFCLGWIIAVGSVLLWLASFGAVRACLNDIFFRGPSAKASHPSDFWWREIYFLKLGMRSFLIACAAFVLSWTAVRASARTSQALKRRVRPLLWILLLGVVAVAIGALASYGGLGADAVGSFGVQLDRINRYLLVPSIYFTFLASALWVLFFAFLWIRGDLSRRQAQFCLFAAVSFCVAFMLSLSFPVFEAMMIPGLGLLVAALLDQWKHWRKLVVYGACALLVAAETYAKLGEPFGFGGINEPPVRTATAVSSLPQLRGFVLPKPIMDFVDQTLLIIEANTKPGDKIFTYPEMGLFYGLSGLTCPTRTCSHNIDVVDDAFARSEAKLLLRNPPAVLIWYLEPEAGLEAEEAVWRHGHRSGQRAIIAAVQQLAQRYRLAGSFVLPPNGYQIKVYVRPKTPVGASSGKQDFVPQTGTVHRAESWLRFF
ncbi:MAG TPA: hypothetical protein VF283_01745 [Bryobacteraceae bacterium]